MRRPAYHATPATEGGWIFRWKGSDAPTLPKLVAVAITALGFGLLLTLVRIEVMPPPGWAEQRAAVIHLPDGGEGRVWRLRALEDGPSPSRFDPASWHGAAAIEEALLGAARLPAERYVPGLLRLPAESDRSAVPLAREGERVFPERRARPAGPDRPAAAAEARPPTPFLYPVAGIAAGQMPERLPPLDPVEQAMTGVEWRFLLRLEAGGGVAECVSITRSDPPGATALEQWLRRASFPASAPEGWVSVGLAFAHGPADHPLAD